MQIQPEMCNHCIRNSTDNGGNAVLVFGNCKEITRDIFTNKSRYNMHLLVTGPSAHGAEGPPNTHSVWLCGADSAPPQRRVHDPIPANQSEF